ncbi:MAG: efflux RND transporter permease subunit, partial [Pseudomonadota bacterium]
MITEFGLNKSRFTYLVMILVLGMGLISYFDIPKRENPAITIRTAAVATYFDGMAPERLEELVAVPIERKIREIGEVEDIETVITNGEALFYITLYDEVYGFDISDAWEDLRNKMADVVGELPEGTKGPFVNTDYGDVAIATVAITGDGFSLAALEDTAEDLRRELYQVEGIAKVSLYGEQDERIWLDLDTRKLGAVRGQIAQVLEDLAAQNVILPAGELDANGTRIVLEANGDLDSLDEIREVLTKVDGLDGFVRLEDLVEVRRDYVDPKEAPVFMNGYPAIMLAVEMSDASDIQDLGVRLKAALDDFEQRQPIGIELHISAFQETNVTAAINNALSNVGQTFVVVFLVMLVFLGVRAAFVIACIVPFTITFAIMNMGFVGVDIEQVSIAAVIISLGLLVDNGLVVVEDIQGRIKRGEEPVAAAKDAGRQYMVPLGVASITTISAFIPMLLVSGSTGEFAFSLGAVVSLMLLGSWLTALYVLPFLSVRLFKPSDETDEKPGFLLTSYARIVRRFLPYGIPLTALVYVLVAGSLTQFSNLKSEMFPLSERSDFIIYMDMPEDTAISETERYALEVERWISNEETNPNVVNTAVYIGEGGPRFYLALNPAKPNPSSAFFVVNMTSFDAVTEIIPRARRTFIEQYPGARFRVAQLSMGGSESGMVEVEITGPYATILMSAADTVERGFADAPNLVRNEVDWGKRVIKVVLDIAQDKAREFGIT